MREIQATLKRSITIWWALAWRWLMYDLFALLFAFGISVLFFENMDTQITIICIHTFLGIPIGMVLVNVILRKKFSGFRIALISIVNEDSTKDAITAKTEEQGDLNRK